MCPHIPDSEYPLGTDAAQALIRLLTPDGWATHPDHASHLRKTIRENWKRICVLAHTIHDEETNPAPAINRAILAVGGLQSSVSTFMSVLESSGYEIRKKETKK